MAGELEKTINEAIWVCKSLFNRNKVSGSSANLSFLYEGRIYITGSGTCFGNLKSENFSIVDFSGQVLNNIKPSKELPLHQMMYQKDSKIKAVLHAHSFYATLWSCLPNSNPYDAIPSYTPYLKMKLGTVGLVPYAKPGSEELFANFSEVLPKSDGFLLCNHGPIVGGKDLLDTFYILEELEESAHIAWELKWKDAKRI